MQRACEATATGDSESAESTILTSEALWAHHKRRRIYVHLCAVHTERDVSNALLKIQNLGRFGEASAFPCAYRIGSNGGRAAMEEYQDNGEVFAGRRLLDLLRYWEIENVLLVASCFDNDSGFTLRASSSERSRHILSSAKTLLEKCVPARCDNLAKPTSIVNYVHIDLGRIAPRHNTRGGISRSVRQTRRAHNTEEETFQLLAELCTIVPEDFETLKILSKHNPFARDLYRVASCLSRILCSHKPNQRTLRGEYSLKISHLVRELASPEQQQLLTDISSILRSSHKLRSQQGRVFPAFFKWLQGLTVLVERVRSTQSHGRLAIDSTRIDLYK